MPLVLSLTLFTHMRSLIRIACLTGLMGGTRVPMHGMFVPVSHHEQE